VEPVWEAANGEEADGACGVLRANGIEHELAGRLVLVPADDVLRALDLLEAWSEQP
jgi:hypothetical protein